MFLEFYFNV
jgi:uncharacterized membrane-anchored protein YitT (DUF2179 family)